MTTRLAVAAVVAFGLAGCEKEHESKPELATGYRCVDRAPEVTPTRLPVDSDGVAFDPLTCEPRATASGGRPLGSWSVELQGKVGAKCVYESTYEMEGGYTVARCEVPAVGGLAHAPIPTSSAAPAGCVEARQGNVFRDMNNVKYVTQLSIPGTHYVVWANGGENKPALASDAPKVTNGSTLKVSFRLYDDEGFERATVGPKSTGEIAFRFGAGEVGTAIERVFSLGASRGAAGHVTFREEVAHGLREKLPGYAREGKICAELTLVEVTPGAGLSAPAGAECPADQVWRCHLGPTSVEQRSDERICGCRYEICPTSTPFLWAQAGDGTWPDGTRKASFECIDDHERIRRSKARSP